MSNERPILFSPAMVRAIIDGKKTQTRRTLKPQPVAWRPTQCEGAYEWRYSRTSAAIFGDIKGALVHCPYGAPGDALWVRETWAATDNDGLGMMAIYRADGEDTGDPDLHWRPSIHMPRWASRLSLRITEVRVERVQDISEADARAEGVAREANGPRMYPSARAARSMESYRDAYVRLWNEINAKRGYGWDTNPWVWVLGFEVLP